MSETVREGHYLDRLQSLRRLASLPEAEHGALSGQERADLVALCVELSDAGRDFIEHESRRIFKHGGLTVSWLQERRRVIEEFSDGYVQVAESIRKSCQQARQDADSPSEDVVALLDVAINRVAEAKRSVLEHWLVGGPQEMAEARAAIARGECLDADTAFAQIVGTDVETWRCGVEEYKRNGSRPTE